MQTYFIDFDHTLFDTDKFFWIDMRRVFANAGVDLECWDISYTKARDGGYTLEKHIKNAQKLCGDKLDGKMLKKILEENFNDLSKYLFNDTVEFLQKTKNSGAKLYLLSFGNPQWQHFKVERSGVVKYFDNIFYTEKENSKADIIGQYFSEHKNIAQAQVVVMDNNPTDLDLIKQSLPQIETRLINRVSKELMYPKTEQDKVRFYGARKYAQKKEKYKHKKIENLHF